MLRSWRSVVVVVMAGVLFAALLLAGCGGSSDTPSDDQSGKPIKIGIDTAMTGTIAAGGVGCVAVAEMFRDEVNASGGILGRQVELIIEDSASDPKTANEKAKILVGKDIDVAMGPILSAERTAAQPVFTEAGIPFLYTTWYEGGAYDDLMFIDGETPEQQTEKFVPWLVEKYGPKFYFAGSDYEFPRGANKKAIEYLNAAGGTVVGDEYIAMGTNDFGSLITRIQKAQPDVLFCDLVGSDATAFAKQFYDYGLSKTIKLASNTYVEAYLQGIGPAASEGIVCCFSYFENLDNPANTAFVAEYKKYDPKYPITTNIEKFYPILKMWQKAVEAAGTTEGQAVAEKMQGISVESPEGLMTMRATDHHCALQMYIAEVDKNGQFVVVENLGVVQPGVDQRQAGN